MKANEAPEKIYVHVKDGKVCNTWNSEWIGVNDIEYTRTDAFIEKACENLKKLMYENLMFQGRLPRDEVINSFVEDFKKHMKGGEE